MIVPSLGVKVLIAMKPTDFRKGMDGLAALVRETLGANPYGGVIYVFRSKIGYGCEGFERRRRRRSRDVAIMWKNLYFAGDSGD